MVNETIYNEDCLLTLSRLKDQSIDLVVTSPPYNMRTRVRDGKYTSRETVDHFSKKYNHFGDDMPIDDFYRFHKAVLAELIRVSKVVCYNFQVVTGSKEAFFKIMGDFSGHIKDVIVWDKGNGQPAMHSKVMNSCHEFILVIEGDHKKGRAIQNAKFARGTMANIVRVGRGKALPDHGAVFPEKLVAILVNAFSGEGDLLYDPFLGTGTTAVVAVKLNRRWFGSEISDKYCETAKRRIYEAKGLF